MNRCSDSALRWWQSLEHARGKCGACLQRSGGDVRRGVESAGMES